MLMPGYDVSTAAQVAAYFALESGGRINILKLSKLLYLVEREYMARFDEPMFYDRLCSMPDGPVASITLNLINGEFDDARWSAFIGARERYDIPVREGVSDASLDHLSKADRALLDDIWERFGAYDRYALRDWTHRSDNIPEWNDPAGSSKPIYHEDVFRFLGKDNSKELARSVEERRSLASAFQE